MGACFFRSAMKAFATDRQQIWIYEAGGGAVFPHKLDDALDLLHSEAECGLFQDLIERLPCKEPAHVSGGAKLDHAIAERVKFVWNLYKYIVSSI